jgi:hypothetical protein
MRAPYYNPHTSTRESVLQLLDGSFHGDDR